MKDTEFDNISLGDSEFDDFDFDTLENDSTDSSDDSFDDIDFGDILKGDDTDSSDDNFDFGDDAFDNLEKSNSSDGSDDSDDDIDFGDTDGLDDDLFSTDSSSKGLFDDNDDGVIDDSDDVIDDSDDVIESDDVIDDTDEVIDDTDENETANTDEDFEFAEFHDGPAEEEEDLGISDGALVDGADLHDDDEMEQTSSGESDFISDSGNIVVQDANDDKENGFELVYVDIDKIAITQRIRKMHSVDALVQSIQSTGLLKPLVVAETATEGLYVLLDGYRRIQACARAGKTKVPCIVNTHVSTPEIPILEAMYNHSKSYSIKEQVDYITYLEKEKGIMNPAMIEYLLQMNSGDYTKLKDILNDNDEDIVNKLFEGVYDIATAFKKLEQRRKKESAEEKENKKAAQVYEDEGKSGVDQIQGSGEEADGSALTEEQIKSLAINVEDLDEGLDNTSISDMIEEDKNIEGFEPHKQKVGEREFVDPIIKKSVMARDNNTCQCCKRGGEQYIDILDFHHTLPIFLGGADTVDNGIMLCVACHRLVHLYSTDDLHIDKALLEGNYEDLTDEQKARYENEQIFIDEKKRFKRIVKLGGIIRKGIAAKGMNKEQYKKEHSNNGIGRRKPGVNAPQEKA